MDLSGSNLRDYVYSLLRRYPCQFCSKISEGQFDYDPSILGWRLKLRCHGFVVGLNINDERLVSLSRPEVFLEDLIRVALEKLYTSLAQSESKYAYWASEGLTVDKLVAWAPPPLFPPEKPVQIYGSYPLQTYGADLQSGKDSGSRPKQKQLPVAVLRPRRKMAL